MQSPPSSILTRKDGEFLRVLASVSVVVAHCIHFWVEEFSRTRAILSLPYFCTVLDQFTRFTVPIFFFLSGFGLTLQFQEKPQSLARYYRFRLVKIMAPFLLWTLLTAFRHFDFIAGLDWAGHPWANTALMLRFVFMDGFDYQYYFLIAIFQFYLVYPFLYRLGRSPLWLGLFLAAHLCLLSPVEVYLDLAGLALPKIHPNLLVFHWFFCFAGIYAAWNKDFLARLAGRWSTAGILGWWGVILVIMNIEFLVNIRNEKLLMDVDHFNRWSVVLYCLASLLVFLKLKDGIAARVYGNPRFSFLFTHGAPYTFFVYLAHTHVLRAVDYLFWEITLFDLLNRIILVVAGSYSLAWFSQWLLEDFPRLRFYLGLPGGRLDWRGLPGLALFRIRRGEAASLREHEQGGLETALDPSKTSSH